MLVLETAVKKGPGSTKQLPPQLCTRWKKEEEDKCL
jgi:hypothetical protein